MAETTLKLRSMADERRMAMRIGCSSLIDAQHNKLPRQRQLANGAA
jgi:hypothetical protein